jgi:uncharacterized protein (DUF1778 family)
MKSAEQQIEGLRDADICCKPTRAVLLRVVEELQNLIGQASAHHGNDRDPDSFELGQKALEQAHDLCIQARSFDPPPQRRWSPRKKSLG